MSTDTIGSGGDYTTIAAWGTAVKAIGTLTENEIGQCTDDASYTHSDGADIDFSAVTLSGNTITMQATGSGVHDGDFGSGARVSTANAYNIIYEAKALTIEDMSFENTDTNSAGVFGNSTFTGKRVIAKCPSTGTEPATVFKDVSGGMDLEACRAFGGKIGIQLVDTGSNLAACTVTDCTTGFDTTVTNAGTIQNNTTYNCTTDWNGTWSGTNTNNADEDSSAPGTSSVTLTVDPFEADGFTPKVSSQLDGAGVDLSITLDCANLNFSATPAIGAYEATVSVGGTSPKGPFTHPLYGPFRGPIS